MDRIVLQKGAHPSLDAGGCVMEFAAWVAGEPHSDHPSCVSPVIGAFLRSWNDALNDTDRQMLVPYAISAIGTNTGKRDEETRAWMATDWLIRVQTPAWLRLAGLSPHAQALESLARVVDAHTARKAQPTVAAARAAAWDAARDAALAAARDAALAAAWDAALAAAWDAARAAALAAAWAKLRPTVETLQASALLLLDAMIAVGRKDEPTDSTRVQHVLASVR